MRTARSQNQTIAQGIITDERGTPLIGATISEKDHNSNISIADSSGKFILLFKGKLQQIRVSYVGYEEQVVKVSGNALTIRLNPSKGSNSDVVVIGYQNQKRRNVTGAISSISGKQIENIPEGSFDQMLQGRLAGVSVQTTSGAPGSKQNITIRGSTNVDYGNENGGNTAPLYVIDGIIYDINNLRTATPVANPLTLINPNDIESIDVLKDASAAAIYGARGGKRCYNCKNQKSKAYNTSGYKF